VHNLVKEEPDNYGVIGHPVSHSLSPRIHAAFAQQCDQHLSYRAIDAEPDQFEQTLQAFAAQGGRGLNVTVPFKQTAWEWVDERDPSAQLAGAVNTIVFDKNGQTCGYNTDGIGLCRDLNQNLNYRLAERKLLLLGAGGAARGVIAPLLSAQPASLTIANRTLERATDLAGLFAELGPVNAVPLDCIPGSYDLVINATSASLKAEKLALPEKLLGPQAAAYDMMYSEQLSPFLQWAAANGAAIVTDGLGMLVEQAAESFQIWRGVHPDTAPVLAALRPNRRD